MRHSGQEVLCPVGIQFQKQLIQAPQEVPAPGSEETIVRIHPAQSLESGGGQYPVRLTAYADSRDGPAATDKAIEEPARLLSSFRGKAALHQGSHHIADRGRPERDIHVARVTLVQAIAIQDFLD